MQPEDEVRNADYGKQCRNEEAVDAAKREALPLPQYRCHKVVGAFKIAKIVPRLDGWTVLVGGDNCYVEVNAEFIRVNPKLNALGYFVRYADGYESYSPSEAFEAGYTRITDDPAPQLADPKFQIGTSAEEGDFVTDVYGRMWYFNQHGVVEPATYHHRGVKPAKPADYHDIGWAVKQMHHGSKVRRRAWDKGRFANTIQDAIYIDGVRVHVIRDENILAIDWEIA